MGAIQQGINQLLGTAAIAARLSPELETKREIKNIDKQLESSKDKVTAQTDYLRKTKDEISEDELIGQLEINQEESKNITGLMKRKFELSPSLGTYSAYSTSKNISNISEKQLNIAKQAQQAKKLAEQRAQQRAQEKGQQQLKQKQRFEKFKEMFTEGGRYK